MVHLLDDGAASDEEYSLYDSFRGVFFNGIECASKYEQLNSSQPETFFILENILNSLLLASNSHYETFKQECEQKFNEVDLMLGIMVPLCALFPLLSYSLTILFTFMLKSKLKRFLNGIYYLTEKEAKTIQAKIQLLKTVFKKGYEENLMLQELKEYSLLGEEDQALGVTIGTSLVKKSKARTKAIAKAKKEVEKRKPDGGSAYAKGSVNFRTLKITTIIFLVVVLSNINFIVFYFVERKNLIHTQKIFYGKESIKSFFLDENLFYSSVIAYIGSKGITSIYEEPVTTILESCLQNEDHLNVIEDLETDFENEEKVMQFISELQSGAMCNSLLKNDEYCPIYNEGILLSPFSLVIKSINTGLRTAIEEFRASEMSENDQKVAMETTILRELPLLYKNGSKVIYEHVLEEFGDVVNEDFRHFYEWHFLLVGILTFINGGLSLFGIVSISFLISSDLIDVKEIYRVVPVAFYTTNKYIRRFILIASPQSIKKYGQKCFG